MGLNKLECLSLTYQPSLLFASKVGGYSSGAPLIYCKLFSSSMNIRLGLKGLLLARVKHSSISENLVYYGRKKFYNIWARSQCYDFCSKFRHVPKELVFVHGKPYRKVCLQVRPEPTRVDQFPPRLGSFMTNEQ